MPDENVVKTVEPDYYHVYICGDARRHFFIEEADNAYFLSLFEKFLINNESVELAAYCLTKAKVNLLFYQTGKGGAAKLMHDIIINYNKYYYDKYKVEDLLSESDYSVSRVSLGEVLDISRKIHLDSDNWIDCRHSSLHAFLYNDTPTWLNRTHISKIYGSAVKYFEFLNNMTE